jgi:class 3 adenylate cyclase/tetratricopeptide (TPR) repeat protein
VPVCASCGRASKGDFRFCPYCAAPLEAVAPPREQRKTVTVVFCDLTGSTALGESIDPEAFRALLGRYFERMKGIVEAHGGSVEKFIGDAVLAVFGVPVAHEDDAVRACRAAIGMRDAFPELGIQGRIGVNTGEVVTGSGEQRLATGDAVNVAARLEQAAEPGEVLVGKPTLLLVRDAVEVEALEPLALKGKSAPVPAFRLIAVREPEDRRHDTAFVGREREWEALLEAWRRVIREQRCELVTLVGDAGVGKSRLVAELLASLGARTIRGRCLSYGEGIGYWPVVEVVKQLDLLPKEESAAAAIRSLLGESEVPTSSDELAWAFRKTLERAAADEPLVVVFDDIHWGEEPFLDLVEHVALFSSGAPMLLFCLARPELLDQRPSWPVALRLEPLAEDDVEALLPESLSHELRRPILKAAGGNPLFVHEMVAMAAETDGELTVPPTLRALLTARLDQLERPERSVLERGAVEGEIFHRGSVQALGGEEQVTPRLATLVRKQLIRPDRAQLPGDDGFRFRHLLIRDAAYDALPKATRAELHAGFGCWLEEHGQSLVELDEILAHHYDLACQYRRELGLRVEHELVASARQRLTAAAYRAIMRGDDRAAANLFERALKLLREGELDLALEIERADAVFRIDPDRAFRLLGSATKRAAAAGDRLAELCCRIEEATLAFYSEPEEALKRLEDFVREALPLAEATGEHYALQLVFLARGQIAHERGLCDRELEEVERALVHARRAGLPNQWGLRSLALARLFGTTPLTETLAWLDEHDPTCERTLVHRAVTVAFLGRIDEGRALLRTQFQQWEERGDRLALGMNLSQAAAEIELTAGDPAAAAELAEAGCRLLVDLGEQAYLRTSMCFLALALLDLGRIDEADECARKAAELGLTDDASAQILWREVCARVSAHRGMHDEAEQLARGAVAIAVNTDYLKDQGDAFVVLAEVLALAGRAGEAAAALREALDRYERKKIVPLVRRVRDRLVALQPV